jgi:hydrogenase 3 maturation protease
MPSRNPLRKNQPKSPRKTPLQSLEARLKGAARVAILGVGSDLRGDDVAGLQVVQKLEKVIGDRDCSNRVRIFHGGTAPENFTGEIRRFEPSHLVVVDAAGMGKPPGTVAILETDQIEGVSFSTHQMPLKVMIKFLGQSWSFETFFIGIQPKDLSFGASVSAPVRVAIRQVVEALRDVLRE